MGALFYIKQTGPHKAVSQLLSWHEVGILLKYELLGGSDAA